MSFLLGFTDTVKDDSDLRFDIRSHISGLSGSYRLLAYKRNELSSGYWEFEETISFAIQLQLTLICWSLNRIRIWLEDQKHNCDARRIYFRIKLDHFVLQAHGFDKNTFQTFWSYHKLLKTWFCRTWKIFTYPEIIGPVSIGAASLMFLMVPLNFTIFQRLFRKNALKSPPIRRRCSEGMLSFLILLSALSLDNKRKFPIEYYCGPKLLIVLVFFRTHWTFTNTN